MPIPRYNPTDPRLPSQVQPFKIQPPKDVYQIFSSSGGMTIAAAAMFTKIPQIGFVALLVSILALLNAPSVQDPNSTGSPWTSLIMAISAIVNAEMGKIMDPLPNRAVPVPAASTVTP